MTVKQFFIFLIISILLSCSDEHGKIASELKFVTYNIDKKLSQLDSNFHYLAFLGYGNPKNSPMNLIKIDNDVNSLVINYSKNPNIDTTVNNYFQRTNKVTRTEFLLIDKNKSIEENILRIKLNELNLIDDILIASSKRVVGKTNYMAKYITTLNNDTIHKGQVVMLRTDTISLQDNPYLLMDGSKVFIIVDKGKGVIEAKKSTISKNFEYRGYVRYKSLAGDTLTFPFDCALPTK